MAFEYIWYGGTGSSGVSVTDAGVVVGLPQGMREVTIRNTGANPVYVIANVVINGVTPSPVLPTQAALKNFQQVDVANVLNSGAAVPAGSTIVFRANSQNIGDKIFAISAVCASTLSSTFDVVHGIAL